MRNNRFVNNRGLRAYGLIFQSTDHSRLEQNEITQNAVGLSFNQCNGNRVAGNRVTQNYIGLQFGSNSDDNHFTENVFARNLHPVETGVAEGTGNKWAVDGVGNRWDGMTEFDLDHDGMNDLPHRELDLFGVLAARFPGGRISLRQPRAQAPALRAATRGPAGPEFDRRSLAAHEPLLEYRGRNARRRRLTPDRAGGHRTMIVAGQPAESLRPESRCSAACRSRIAAG